MKLFIWIYSIPLWAVGLVIFGGIFLWLSLAVKYDTIKRASTWKTVNILLFLLEIVIVLILTIFSREHTDTELRMIPFETLIKAKGQPEFYRTMLMNILLFFHMDCLCHSFLQI